jgi:hypothetical protein
VAWIENGVIVTEASRFSFKAPTAPDVVQAIAFADNPALTVGAVLESVRVDIDGIGPGDYLITVRLVDVAGNKKDNEFHIRNVAAAGPADTDHDGIPDEVEIQWGLDPNDATDASGDKDKDCLSNLEEYTTTHTNGNNADTDGDGLSDGCDELANGLNPLDPTDADKDLDGDGDTNRFEIEIGTQIDDAGSGLAHAAQWPDPDPTVHVDYMSNARFLDGTYGKLVFVLAPDARGGMKWLTEYMILPEPLRAAPGILSCYVFFHSEVLGVLQGDIDPAWLPIWLGIARRCNLLGYDADSILELCVQPDLSVKGGQNVYHIDPEGFGLRKSINALQADEQGQKQRRIPWLDGTPGGDGLPGKFPFGDWTLDLDRVEKTGTVHYSIYCRPIRTDLDMQIAGTKTWCDSVTQDAPPYAGDVKPRETIEVTAKLPAEPQGYQGLNAARTVNLSWPEACFTATDENGNPVGNAQTKQGQPPEEGGSAFTWRLTRTEAPMAPGESLSASVDSIRYGSDRFNDIRPVSLGEVSVRPEAVAEIGTPPIPVEEVTEIATGPNSLWRKSIS